MEWIPKPFLTIDATDLSSASSNITFPGSPH